MSRNFKGGIFLLSDVFWMLCLFMVTMAILFAGAIFHQILGQTLRVTIHGVFFQSTINNENSMLSFMECTDDEVKMKTLMAYAAFEWDTNPNWDTRVYYNGNFFDFGAKAQYWLDRLTLGSPYIFELRKENKRIIIAERDADKLAKNPYVTEIVFELPYDKEASYRLYGNVESELIA